MPDEPNLQSPAMAAGDPATPAALPGPLRRDDHETGRGQSLVVIALTLANALVVAYMMLFVVPPNWSPPAIAFGGPLLLATCLMVQQVRDRGFAPGEPPPDAASRNEVKP